MPREHAFFMAPITIDKVQCYKKLHSLIDNRATVPRMKSQALSYPADKLLTPLILITPADGDVAVPAILLPYAVNSTETSSLST